MRIPCRRHIGGGLKALLYALHGRTPGHGVRVLEYHYIDDTASPLSVSAAEFRAHLEVLRDGGWKALTSDEFLARLDLLPDEQLPKVDGSPTQMTSTPGQATQATIESQVTPTPRRPGSGALPRPSAPASVPDESRSAREVFITFDDGQETFASAASPLLAEFGFPATLFVVTDLVGKSAQWFERDRDRIEKFLSAFAFSASERAALSRHWQTFASARLIDWDGLRRLVAQGINVENHSASHHFLTQLSDDDVKEDLQRSGEALRRELGTDSRLLCYPYGDTDARIANAARDAGFRAGFMSAFAVGAADPMRIGRLPIGAGTFQFRFALSRAMDVLTRMRL